MVPVNQSAQKVLMVFFSVSVSSSCCSCNIQELYSDEEEKQTLKTSMTAAVTHRFIIQPVGLQRPLEDRKLHIQAEVIRSITARSEAI